MRNESFKFRKLLFLAIVQVFFRFPEIYIDDSSLTVASIYWMSMTYCNVGTAWWKKEGDIFIYIQVGASCEHPNQGLNYMRWMINNESLYDQVNWFYLWPY